MQLWSYARCSHLRIPRSQRSYVRQPVRYDGVDYVLIRGPSFIRSDSS